MNSNRDKKIIGALRCPICKEEMDVDDSGCGVLYCKGARRHSYDFSSAGYVNLSAPGQSNGGDSKVAVRARSAFLDTGYYAPVSDMLCKLLKEHCKSGDIVVDAGCGEGYYSVAVAQSGFKTIGFDLSKFATEAAAKRARREGADNTLFGVSSVFAMPLANRSANAVVNVFAPCVESEYSRVLSDDGRLIVVYAGPEHLLGLKAAIYERTHTNEERADMPAEMREIERRRLKYDIKVIGNQSIKELFAMTPYYWRTSIEDVKKLDGLCELDTTVDIIFAVYGK